MYSRSFKNIVKTSSAALTTDNNNANTGNQAGGAYFNAVMVNTAAGALAPLVAAANRFVAPLLKERGEQHPLDTYTVYQEYLFDAAPANVAGGLAFGQTYDALHIRKDIEVVIGIKPIAHYESVSGRVFACPSDIVFEADNKERKIFIWFPDARAANYIGIAGNLKGVRFELVIKVLA